MEQTQRPKVDTKKEEAEVANMPPATVDREKTLGEIDDLLDDIETVLDENASEFVQAYVQKGGQ